MAYLLKAMKNKDNAKVAELTDKLKEYEAIINELKHDRDKCKQQLGEHDERIEALEENANKNTEHPLLARTRELEYEIKLLTDRVKDVQLRTNDLSAERKKVNESLNDEESDSPELKQLEDTRKSLETDLNSLKGRTGQIEDKLKLLNMKIQDNQAKPDSKKISDSDEERVTTMEENLEKLKKKMEELESLLKKMKRKRKIQISNDSTDINAIIDELREELESDMDMLKARVTKVEDISSNANFRSTNNESRISNLELSLKDQENMLSNLFKDVSSRKGDFEQFEKKLKELQDLVNQKVDQDLFDQQIISK